MGPSKTLRALSVPTILTLCCNGESMPLDKDDPYIQREIKKRMNSWYLFLNEIFGVLGFSFALGALGTQSSEFYASLSLLLLTLLYIPEYLKRRHLIKILREEKHEYLKLLNLFRGAAVYIFGFSVLILTAIGVFQSNSTICSIINNAT